jgi:hypothetical protein
MNAFFSKVLISAASLPGLWLAANASETTSEAIAVRNSARIATVHAEGTQTYVCKQKSEESPSQPRALIWESREPIAKLSANGMSIGRHYAGPNWDYFDGSGVKGKVVASAPGATENDIPWLKLGVVEHRGDGILSNVTAVQRINTKGGVALGACEIAGSLLIVPYSADYVFVRQKVAILPSGFPVLKKVVSAAAGTAGSKPISHPS